jgi:prolyl oligopeptidase
VYNSQNPKSPLSLEQAAAKKLVSKSGYPLNIYMWKRGAPIASMVKVFEADSNSMTVRVAEIPRYEMGDPADSYFLISEHLNFFESRYTLHSKDQAGSYVPQVMDFPIKADYMGFTDTHYFFFKLKADWKNFKADTIIAFHSRREGQKVLISEPESVYIPDEGRTLRYAYVDQGEQFDPADDLIIVSTIKNVVPQNYFLTFGQSGRWDVKEIEDPSGLRFKDAHLWKEEGGDLYYTVNGFLMPKTEYRLTRRDQKLNFEQTDQDLKTFSEKGLEVEQLWVDRGKDADGKEIRVPYFIVYNPKKVSLEKNQVPVPTVISAYGGFNVPLLPVYLKYQGKFWLENGGVYVLANIRGGGEFGSRWHQSVLKTSRQLAFDDLIAVSEDLIRRGITSPKKLGISGGSNGGLLMGAMMVQRPELFSAIYIAVPLLDMMRYHKLLAGASWMAEYGDPEGAERDFWLAKSPLHNLRAEQNYPKVYLQTNRFDDRVHPGHARKMANSLKKMKKDFYFFEDTKGGHGGADRSSEEQAAVSALYYAYLMERLF